MFFLSSELQILHNVLNILSANGLTINEHIIIQLSWWADPAAYM